MMYLDANIFIYGAGSSTTKGEQARNVVQNIQDGNFQAATSVLSFDETVWALRKQIGEEAALIATHSFFLLPELNIYSVTREIFLSALEVMRHEKLKPRDAVHIATMRAHGTSKILSEDPDFDKIKGIKRISLEDFKLSKEK